MSSSLRIALVISALAGVSALAVAATTPSSTAAAKPATKSTSGGTAAKAAPGAAAAMPAGIAPQAKALLESVGHAYGD